MPFDEENKGDPFRGDFPGRSEPSDQPEPLWQRQVAELARRRYEPTTRHQLLELLQRRRERQQQAPPEHEQRDQRAGRAGRHDITQFDFLPVDEGFDILLARAELLITGPDYDGRPERAGSAGADRYAKGYLDALGMVVSEVDCAELEGRIVRLTHPQMGPQELSDVARDLRTRGFAASLTNITPTGYVTKSVGGPLPTAPPRSYQNDPGPGAPANVAIIDTGITAERRGDGWLADVPRGDDVDPLYAFPLSGRDDDLDLDAGHGTFVAGIVQQVAPDARIKVYRAVDSDGIASEVTVAAEMIRAVKEGAGILNLSLGCQTQDNVPPIAIAAALDVISEWDAAEGREVIIVAAAGNYADSTPCWPAAFRSVVSVAALAPDMLPLPWSSRGSWVTCSTIGHGLRSTFVKGRESALVVPEPHDFGADAWAAWSGTSFAAPQITGALARLHEKDQYPLREALRRLLAAGRPVPDFGQAIKILPGI